MNIIPFREFQPVLQLETEERGRPIHAIHLKNVQIEGRSPFIPIVYYGMETNWFLLMMNELCH